MDFWQAVLPGPSRILGFRIRINRGKLPLLLFTLYKPGQSAMAMNSLGILQGVIDNNRVDSNLLLAYPGDYTTSIGELAGFSYLANS